MYIQNITNINLGYNNHSNTNTIMTLKKYIYAYITLGCINFCIIMFH